MNEKLSKSCGFDDVVAAVEAKKPVIVDVRTEDEFASGRIPGATNIPLQEVKLFYYLELYKNYKISHKM